MSEDELRRKIDRKIVKLENKIQKLKLRGKDLSIHGRWILGYYEGSLNQLEIILDSLNKKERANNMAMVDYGAMLSVNGEFVNRGTVIFMNSSETGYVCESAEFEDGQRYNVNGNFFVLAGDEDLLLAFYKGSFLVISNEKVIKSVCNVPFASETFELPNGQKLKVSHLDKECYAWSISEKEIWEDYPVENRHKNHKESMKDCKKAFRYRKNPCKIRTDRWLAEWDHKGNHYEVIFGYGVESSERIWNRTKDNYEFTDTEKSIMEEWFRRADSPLRDKVRKPHNDLSKYVVPCGFSAVRYTNMFTHGSTNVF